MSARIAQATPRWRARRSRAGELVILYLAGANRDPEVFDDPHRFDITRENAGKHLSFSGGRHFCLGAALARAEGEVGLRTFFERYPGRQPGRCGQPPRHPSVAGLVVAPDQPWQGARPRYVPRRGLPSNAARRDQGIRRPDSRRRPDDAGADLSRLDAATSCSNTSGAATVGLRRSSPSDVPSRSIPARSATASRRRTPTRPSTG